MKTLIVFDKEGNIICTSGATDTLYACTVDDIKSKYIPVIFDLTKNKVITTSVATEDEEINKIVEETKEKNKKWNEANDFVKLKEANEELNKEIKEKIEYLNKKINIAQLSIAELSDV